MTLITKIAKTIDASILDFCKAVASKYDIDQEELMNMWNESSGGLSTKKPKKRSAYQNFSSFIRPQIKEEYPDIKFGDISKEISKRWKDMDDSEKIKYQDAESESKKLVSKENEMVTGYQKMKVVDLKKLCKDRDIKVNGLKKAEIIECLEEYDAKISSSSASTPANSSSASSPANSSSVSSPANSAKGSPIYESENEQVNSPSLSIKSSSNESLSEMSDSDDESVKSSKSSKKNKINKKSYKDMKLPELKELLNQKGLSTKGKKGDLIERLISS